MARTAASRFGPLASSDRPSCIAAATATHVQSSTDKLARLTPGTCSVSQPEPDSPGCSAAAAAAAAGHRVKQHVYMAAE
jgi:hypothetical protein